jgi:hypothetical protein
VAAYVRPSLIASGKTVFEADSCRIWLVPGIWRVIFTLSIDAGKFVAGARIFNLCLHGKLEKLWYLVVEEYSLASMITMLGQLDGG